MAPYSAIARTDFPYGLITEKSKVEGRTKAVIGIDYCIRRTMEDLAEFPRYKSNPAWQKYLLTCCPASDPSSTSFNEDHCNHCCLKPRRRSARSCFICATSSRASASIAPRSFNSVISSLLSAAFVLVSSAILCFD